MQIKRKKLFAANIVIISVLSSIIVLSLIGDYSENNFLLSNEVIEKYDLSNENTLVIAPLFTSNAYSPGGFYDYFKKKCDESCLSLTLDTNPGYSYTSSGNALYVFDILGADITDDLAINNDLSILDNYETIVLLHNEYVTIEMFNAITNHKNVIYLYPNSLYAEIEIKDNVMTLLQGHSYKSDKVNVFDWEFENTNPDEYDLDCNNIIWKPTNNGYQLNCYPELQMINTEILEFIKLN